MLSKLTDLWPQLLGQRRNDEATEEADKQGETEADKSAASNDDVAAAEGACGEETICEEQLLADYHRLNWTRLMVITDYETDQARKWPLGPDIVEEC